MNNNSTSHGDTASASDVATKPAEIPYDKNEFEIDGDVLKKYKGNSAEVTIPVGVARVGRLSFIGCDSLTKVAIPSTVTNIDEYAFCGCISLASVTIPSSVTSIGEHAFDACVSLTSVTFPSSVLNIDEYAFCGCISLASVTIPSSVISIGYGVFYGCGLLESIVVEEGNARYHGAGNCLIETKSKTLVLGCKNSLIPDDGSVTSVGSFAFERSALTSVTIPSSITSIENYAFFECRSLTSFTIPSSVTSISANAFAHCSSLKSIAIPNSVTSIDEYAFYHCYSLEKIIYYGAKEQWDLVKKGYGWDEGVGNYTVIFNTTNRSG